MRFGFVVGKTVGNAVVRNRLRRRMRAAAYAQIAGGATGMDIVLRALPGAAELTVPHLEALISSAIEAA